MVREEASQTIVSIFIAVPTLPIPCKLGMTHEYRLIIPDPTLIVYVIEKHFNRRSEVEVASMAPIKHLSE
jgi:hypothetical protein